MSPAAQVTLVGLALVLINTLAVAGWLKWCYRHRRDTEETSP